MQWGGIETNGTRRNEHNETLTSRVRTYPSACSTGTVFFRFSSQGRGMTSTDVHQLAESSLSPSLLAFLNRQSQDRSRTGLW